MSDTGSVCVSHRFFKIGLMSVITVIDHIYEKKILLIIKVEFLKILSTIIFLIYVYYPLKNKNKYKMGEKFCNTDFNKKVSLRCQLLTVAPYEWITKANLQNLLVCLFKVWEKPMPGITNILYFFRIAQACKCMWKEHATRRFRWDSARASMKVMDDVIIRTVSFKF